MKWLCACITLLLVALSGGSNAIEINANEPGYESPIAAVESIRDSTGLALPMTLEMYAPSQAALANLDIWLHGIHPGSGNTWATTCKDTLQIERVYP